MRRIEVLRLIESWEQRMMEPVVTLLLGLLLLGLIPWQEIRGARDAIMSR